MKQPPSLFPELDSEDATPPSGHSVHDLSSPQWSAPSMTGSFASPGFAPPSPQTPAPQPGAHAPYPQPYPQPYAPPSMLGQTPYPPGPQASPYGGAPTYPGAHPHLGAQPPIGAAPTYPGAQPPAQAPYAGHATGSYASPIPHPQAPFGQAPTPPHSVYSSPGYSPPTPHGGYHTGSYAAIQHTPSQGFSMEHMTGTFNVPNLIAQQQQQQLQANQEEASKKRFSFAIWGGAVGAILGVLLGVLNAILEGVPLHAAQTPLILLAMICMIIGAGSAAYAPETFERTLRQLGVLPSDD